MEDPTPVELTSTITADATPPRERIQSLDVLRGFALLGILVMNVQSFSMVAAAYFNPSAYGDLTGANKWAWILSHVLADQKFMTLFSILFGAGILLMSLRAEAKGLSPALLHYRRTAGLLLIGLAHAYLFWYGDILVWYSLCSLLVFLFRKKGPKTLLVLGLICVAVPSLLFFLFGWGVQHMPPDAAQEMLKDWRPGSELIAEEVETYRSGWVQQMSHRVPTALGLHTFVFLIWASWRAGGLMLIGMAFFKWGVLSAQRSKRFYLTAAIVGFGVGWPVIGYGVVRNFAEGWSMEYSRFYGSQFNYWGSLLVSLGYLSVVMLACQSGWVSSLQKRLSAVGRLALTNYLLQTLICTTIFYGHGLGLFGAVERTGLLVIVFVIWAFQLIVSPIWLRHFRFGPFEWAWRSLTYLRLQRLRKATA